MALAKWNTPSVRSANIAGTVLNSLGIGLESSTVTYDNSTNLDLYAAMTIKLGSITPTVASGITVRVTINDGTDTSDKVGGDRYVAAITTTSGAKIMIIPMIRLYPFSLRFSFENNTGVTLSATGNEVYIRPWIENIT